MSPSELSVFINKRYAATLSRQDGPVRAEYADEYLDDPESVPLSMSLPLRPGALAQRATLRWLHGILPAAPEARARLAETAGVSTNDLFGLLAHVGLDCPGAVQICPRGAEDGIVHEAERLEAYPDDQIAERLRGLRRDKGSWLIPDEHWSLGGAQAKFTLTRIDGRWHRPLGGAASTHIVKPGVAGISAQALNEHVCLRALARVGVLTVNTEYATFEGQPAIVIERFDRRVRGREVTRLHQEDVCQALAKERAYESRGGPSVRTIADLFNGSVGRNSLRRFVEGVLAHYLLGSPDGHARNYSLAHPRGAKALLAPVYDVASSLPYRVGAGGRMVMREVAMAIGGERRFGWVTARHWARLFTVTDVEPDWGFARIREIAGALPDAVASELAAIDDQVAADLAANFRPALDRHLERLLDGFDRDRVSE